MSQPMELGICADASAFIPQSSAIGRQLPATPTPSDIGRKRASEYLRDVLETPPKSRRLEIANELKSLEMQRSRTVNRIKKERHQIREVAARLVADETQLAQFDQKIRLLKLEDAAE